MFCYVASYPQSWWLLNNHHFIVSKYSVLPGAQLAVPLSLLLGVTHELVGRRWLGLGVWCCHAPQSTEHLCPVRQPGRRDAEPKREGTDTTRTSLWFLLSFLGFYLGFYSEPA